MGPYELAAIIVFCGALVGVAYFVARAVRHGREVVTRPVDAVAKGATHVAERAADSVDHAVDAAAALARPVAEACGEIGKAIADRVRVRQEELDKMRDEVAQLTAQVAYLENRRINVDQARSVLKVAFVEVDLSYTDFELAPVPETSKSGTWATRAEREEYLGVVQADYKQRLGVDLEELKFQRIGSDEIGVLGLGKVEFIGASRMKFTRRLIELRHHLDESKLLGAESTIIKGDPEDHRAIMERAQLDRIVGIVNQRADSRTIDQAIEHLALSFLSACFGSARFRVRAVDSLTEPRSFFDICNEINAEVTSKIADAEQALQRLRANMQRVEAELLTESVRALDSLPHAIAHRMAPARGAGAGRAA